MRIHVSLLLVCLIGFGAALPPKPILSKLDDLRYQHARDSVGNYNLVDTWMTQDASEVARFQPLVTNIYHLFTRDHPSVSHPLLINNTALLDLSDYDSSRRTIVLIHGWRDGGVASSLVTNLVPAFLDAENVNVIVVDWSLGTTGLITATVENAISSGEAVGAFIDWLNQETGSNPVQYHIVGHGMGAHQAGIVGRNLNGAVAYITGLDPSLVGWLNHEDRFRETDGAYTEVIHTNTGFNGYLTPLAQVDIYPNGGDNMPGCDSNACDHERSIYYFAESIVSGGFTSRLCASYLAAILQNCNILPIRVEMGGLRPKMGSTGAYLVETNASPPFSQQ